MTHSRLTGYMGNVRVHTVIKGSTYRGRYGSLEICSVYSRIADLGAVHRYEPFSIGFKFWVQLLRVKG